MKKIFSIVILAMAGLTACTKKSSTSSDTGTMSATAGGATFSASHCYESSSGDYYSIMGQSSTTTFISINIKTNNLQATTYNFDNTGLNNAASYEINGVAKAAKTGSVTITSINPGVNMKGTFSFTCADGTAVSNGSFTAVF